MQTTPPSRYAAPSHRAADAPGFSDRGTGPERGTADPRAKVGLRCTVGHPQATRDPSGGTDGPTVNARASTLAFALDAAQMGTWELDLRADTIFWSDRIARLHGWPYEERVTPSAEWYACVHPDDRETVVSALHAALGSDGQYEAEFRCLSPHGDMRWFASRGHVIYDCDGAPARVAGVAFDITERKTAEQQHRESEERFHAIYSQSAVPICTFDLDGRIRMANRAACLFLGLTEAEITSSRVQDLVMEEDRQEVESILIAFRGGTLRSYNEDCAFPRRDGSVAWGHANTTVVSDGQGQPLYAISIVADVTEQKRAEAVLRANQQRLHLALQSANMGTFEFDAATGKFDISPETSLLFGLGAGELGDNLDLWERCVHPEDLARVNEDALRVMQVGENATEYRIVWPDGTVRWMLARARALYNEAKQPRGIVGVVMDITDRRQTEQQLLQAQKMEGIGRLAGGIAHDFNNLLSVVLGYAELTQMDLPEQSPLWSNVQNIQAAAMRAGALTQQLLAFARRQSTEPTVVDLNELLTTTGSLLKPLLGEDIELSVCANARAVRVKLDKNQFEQVIVNLAVNARDAMPLGGALTIRTDTVRLSGKAALGELGGKTGQCLKVSVADSGMGMSEDVKAHIFEPFFTTKELGKGTGLGLATCYGIVRQSGGRISVESKPGAGTTFEIYLPLVEDPAEGSADGPCSLQMLPGNATVLVVEDEEQLRALVVGALRANGYNALEASDGVEALEVARAYAAPIDLLLTDLIMPRMGGLDLAQALKAERDASQMKVAFVSGYSADSAIINGNLPNDTILIEKPVPMSELLRRVAEFLDPATTG